MSVSYHDDETKPRGGRPPSKAVTKIMREAGVSRATAFRKLGKRKLRQRTQRERLEAETTEFSSIIKPSDNWNFNAFYHRIDDGDGHGYIPGDLYANCLFYNTKPNDLVIAPMAGSGQIMRVYEDRALWMRPKPWKLDLRMFDLTPRGPYKHLIQPWNLLTGFPPVERPPDFVIMDPPYLSIVKRQYSKKATDIANMDQPAWTRAMQRIAQSCASARAKRCTVVMPNYWGGTYGAETPGAVVLCTEIVRAAWAAVGYRLVGIQYASRHIQGVGSRHMNIFNNRAKRTRQPLCDIAEVLTFERPPEPPRRGRRSVMSGRNT